MSAHSPGPWVAVEISGTIIDDAGEVIASVGMGRLPDEYAHDARLIATAPALLASLRELLATMTPCQCKRRDCSARASMAVARAVIADAEGRP